MNVTVTGTWPLDQPEVGPVGLDIERHDIRDFIERNNAKIQSVVGRENY